MGQGQGRIQGVKGAKGREVKGANMEQTGSEGEQKHFYTRF